MIRIRYESVPGTEVKDFVCESVTYNPQQEMYECVYRKTERGIYTRHVRKINRRFVIEIEDEDKKA